MPTGEGDLVVVATFLHQTDAELAQGALEAVEIESTIQADGVGTPPGRSMSGVRLLVRAEDVKRANSTLKLSADKPADE